jgi:predicted acyl esterase
MLRGLVALVSAISAIGSAPSAHTTALSDVTLTMDDGVQLACSANASGSQPAPGIILFHGLGGRHEDLAPIANAFAAAGYATLACDARGHGRSGGQTDIDGPRTIADVRTEYQWLATRPGVESARIGAWGISLGGGAVWRSLIDGVPFAAVETVETWTDLYQALAPQDLTKSGAVYGFLNSVPQSRLDPSILALRADALASRNLRELRRFAGARSSRTALDGIHVPALIFQGRRDFAFGLEQGLELYAGLGGPKHLYIGDFGHFPSSFPGPDIAPVTAEAIGWFDRYLKGTPNGVDRRNPVELARDPYREAPPASYAGLPPTRTLRFRAAGRKTFGGSGKVVRALGVAKTNLESFGAGVVRVSIAPQIGWSHLIAVLTARTPAGRNVLVSEGGVPTARRMRTVAIRLVADATFVPRGSRLSLTLAGSSAAQSADNPLYLSAVPSNARIAIGRATLRLPVLRRTISG